MVKQQKEHKKLKPKIPGELSDNTYVPTGKSLLLKALKIRKGTVTKIMQTSASQI